MDPNELTRALHSPFWLDIPPFPARTFTVSSFNSEHLALNSNYAYTLHLHTQTRITNSSLLQLPAKLIFDDTMIPKQVHGIIHSIKQLAAANTYFVYEVVLVPPTHLLTTLRKPRVFLNQTIQTIANTVLAPLAAQWPNLQTIHWNLKKSESPRKLIVQYHETDWDFLRRILSSADINFTFLHKDNLELVLFDDINSLPSVGALPYATQASMMRTTDTVWNVIEHTALSTPTQQAFTTAHTDNMLIQPGMLITITQHPDQHFNQSYRVISQKTSGQLPEQSHYVEDDEAPQFMSELQLITAHSSYQATIIPHKPFYGTFVARTESISNDTQAHLNEEGHYRVRLPFDKSNTENAQASPPLMLVQTHGGSQSGFHHPLLANTPVIIGARDGDIEDPVILGAWPCPSHQAPVTSANANDHIMRSPQGHTLQLTDHSDAPFINIIGADQINQLTLQSDLSHPFVALTTQGSLLVKAKKTLTGKTEQNANHSVGSNASITAMQNQQTLVQGESNYESSVDFITQTKQHLTRQTTQGNIIKQAQNNIFLQAKNDHTYLSEQGNITFNSAQALNIISGNDLTLATDKALTIESNGHLISFSSSGEHLINAKAVNFNAPTINFNGSVSGLNPSGLSSTDSSASQFGNNAISIPQSGADLFIDQEAGLNNDETYYPFSQNSLEAAHGSPAVGSSPASYN